VLATAALQAAGLRVVDPPVALDWSATDRDFEIAVAAALSDDGNDAVMVIHAPPDAAAVSGPTEMIDRAAADADRPVIAVMLGALDGPLQPGSAVQRFSFPEAAAAVLGRLHDYSRWRHTEGEAAVHEPIDIDRRAVAELLRTALDDAGTGISRYHLGPEQIRTMLALYGVTMADCEVVAPAQAIAAAERIGYPVAVKATRHRRSGPSVQAGVALDLTAPDDVSEAIETMTAHLGAEALEVVMVQQMAEPGVNLRIRATLDPVMGPVISAGLGGVLADVIGDSASRLAPISSAAASALLAKTRAGVALDDEVEHQAAQVLVRIAQLVSDHPEIVELDLNPVIAGAAGVTVVDASIEIAPAPRTEHPLRRL
jgi:acyl-CoA synthetase (NDP forming)